MRDSLAAKLILAQEQGGLTDTQMAALLKVPRTTWSSLKTGRTKGSARIAVAAWQAFPHLRKHFYDPPDATGTEVA